MSEGFGKDGGSRNCPQFAASRFKVVSVFLGHVASNKDISQNHLGLQILLMPKAVVVFGVFDCTDCVGGALGPGGGAAEHARGPTQKSAGGGALEGASEGGLLLE